MHTTNTETRQAIKRMLCACAVAVALVGSAGAMWFGGAGTALAPEPASLRATLGTAPGSTAGAVGYYSNTPTSVVRWPLSASTDDRVRALGTGHPCSTVPLLPYQTTSKVLTIIGSITTCM